MATLEELEDLRKLQEVIDNHKIPEPQPGDFDYDEPEFVDYESNEDEHVELSEPNIPKFFKTDVSKLNNYASSEYVTTTEAEKALVDSCTDLELRELLLLNRTKYRQLMQMYRVVKDLLIECQADIAAQEEYCQSKLQCNKKKLHPKIWRLGIPYFKGEDNFPCPPNADTLRKVTNGELLFYDISPSNKWIDRDKNRLMKGVSFYYKLALHDDLQKQISDIQSKPEHERGELDALQEKLNKILDPESVIYPPIGNESRVDWVRLSGRLFGERYSSDDCEAYWRLYLHPNINKGSWDKKELKRLKELVQEYKMQNWDKIAQALGTNRTGFVVCSYYFSRKQSAVQLGKFSPEEDKKLLALIEKYRQGDYIPWGKITHYFKGRIRSQVFHRYKYYLSYKHKEIHRNKFTEAENVLLLVLVERFGKRFSQFKQHFPNRSMVQLKSHYNSNLCQAIKKGTYTYHDDQKILKFAKKNGVKSWHKLAPIMNRCSAQIRQRYHTLIRFQQANPDATLQNAPRRRFGGLSGDKEHGYLRYMADKFKDCPVIPTLADIEKMLEESPKPVVEPLRPLWKLKSERYQRMKRGQSEAISYDSDSDAPAMPSVAIDDLIIDYFSTSMKRQFEQAATFTGYIESATGATENILGTLQGNLYIPQNFQSDNRLDNVDLLILSSLVKESPIEEGKYVVGTSGDHVGQLLTPNLNTVVGMRCLLIKNQVYKNTCIKKELYMEDFRRDEMERQVAWCIDNHLSSSSEKDRQELLDERRLFVERFFSLFRLPALLSIIRPSDELNKVSEPKPLRTYCKKARPNQNVPEIDTNVNVIVKAELPDVKEKISMAEQLKRKINQTLVDLTHYKPAKRPIPYLQTFPRE